MSGWVRTRLCQCQWQRPGFTWAAGQLLGPTAVWSRCPRCHVHTRCCHSRSLPWLLGAAVCRRVKRGGRSALQVCRLTPCPLPVAPVLGTVMGSVLSLPAHHAHARGFPGGTAPSQQPPVRKCPHCPSNTGLGSDFTGVTANRHSFAFLSVTRTPWWQPHRSWGAAGVVGLA